MQVDEHFVASPQLPRTKQVLSLPVIDLTFFPHVRSPN
jgi:hypothetical protein